MSFHIVCDSCTDLTNEDFHKGCYSWIPLTLIVDDEEIVDDETFDQASFLTKVANSSHTVKSACPSPDLFRTAYGRGDDIYVVTLSAELSGSYNSAVLAKNMYEEKHGPKNIHVFNSRGASTTQILIARRIYQYASEGMPFDEVVANVESYINTQRTFFILETLDVLQKNGRLSKVSATIANVLNIKPVMAGNHDGIIEKLTQARGTKKALMKLVSYIVDEGRDLSKNTLAIAHCNCPKRAEFLRDKLLEKMKIGEVIIIDTKGVSSMYACDGGIILSY